MPAGAAIGAAQVPPHHLFHPPGPVPFHPLYGFFFFNDTATTEIYTLSLHDALPILCLQIARSCSTSLRYTRRSARARRRSEEHTSELQSHLNLVCRLLLEKKRE